MPLETLKTLQDLEITGATGSQQDDTLRELVETDGQQPAQTLHPSAPHPALQAHPSEQPHSTPFYPPLLNSFAYGTDSTLPIDPGLLDARFDHSAASGTGAGAVAGFHHGPWAPQLPPSASMDGFMTSPTSLPQYTSTMPLVPGMSSFEPMVSTTWSMDGSLPSASTSSRGPTMSTMSMPSTSTQASTTSPSSPGRASAGRTEPRAASKEALTTQMGMQPELRAEDQPNKKRRQTTGHRATTKTSTEKRGHRNNSLPGFSTPQVPIAPAPIAVAGTSDDNKKNINKKKGSSSSSSRHHRQTTTTTTSPTTTATPSTASSSSAGPSQPGPSTQQPPTLAAGQPPDPRARNREAANRCRAKSKVAVAELEATERAMSGEHQALTQTARTLRDEVLSLKNELLMHGNCDDELIQQYLVNSARMVGSGAVAMGATVTTTGAIPGGGVPGLPTQPPGPSMAGPPGAGVGSSQVMLPASPPRVPPLMPPSSAALDLETTAPRGRGGGRKQ